MCIFCQNGICITKYKIFVCLSIKGGKSQKMKEFQLQELFGAMAEWTATQWEGAFGHSVVDGGTKCALGTSCVGAELEKQPAARRIHFGLHPGKPPRVYILAAGLHPLVKETYNAVMHRPLLPSKFIPNCVCYFNFRAACYC